MNRFKVLYSSPCLRDCIARDRVSMLLPHSDRVDVIEPRIRCGEFARSSSTFKALRFGQLLELEA